MNALPNSVIQSWLQMRSLRPGALPDLYWVASRLFHRRVIKARRRINCEENQEEPSRVDITP